MTVARAPFRGALFGLACFGSYACSDMSLKFLGQNIPAMQVVFLTGLFVLPWVVARTLAVEGPTGFIPRLPGWMAIRLAITFVNGVFVTYTFSHLPLAQCYAVFFTMPLIITVLAGPVLGEPIDLPRGLIVLMGFVGVIIAVQPGSVPLELAHLTALGGATMGAMNSLILRKIGTRERTGAILFYPPLFQTLVLAFVMPFVWQPVAVHQWAVGAGFGVTATMGGIFIIAAYRRAPAIMVAPMQYSQIIWASLGGVLFFDERPTWAAAIGIAVIVLAGLTLLWLSSGDKRDKVSANAAIGP